MHFIKLWTFPVIAILVLASCASTKDAIQAYFTPNRNSEPVSVVRITSQDPSLFYRISSIDGIANEARYGFQDSDSLYLKPGQHTIGIAIKQLPPDSPLQDTAGKQKPKLFGSTVWQTFTAREHESYVIQLKLLQINDTASVEAELTVNQF